MKLMDETIILLHGWGVDASRLDNLRHKLAGLGFNVVAPDLPGFGNAETPEFAWTVNDYAAWLHQYLNSKSVNKFYLLGHSFGGQCALKFTSKYPEYVKGLILVAPAGVRKKRKPHQWIILWLTEAGKMIFSIPGLDYLSSKVKEIWYRIIGSMDYYRAAGIMKEIVVNILNEDLRDLMGGVIPPVLLIWGKRDKLTPFEDHKYYLARIPKIKFVIHEDGHNFIYDDADFVIEQIIAFINQQGNS